MFALNGNISVKSNTRYARVKWQRDTQARALKNHFWIAREKKGTLCGTAHAGIIFARNRSISSWNPRKMDLSLLALQHCLRRFARALSTPTVEFIGCRRNNARLSQIRGEKSYPADCASRDREKTRDETKSRERIPGKSRHVMLGQKIRRRGMEIPTRYLDCNFQTNECNIGYVY